MQQLTLVAHGPAHGLAGLDVRAELAAGHHHAAEVVLAVPRRYPPAVGLGLGVLGAAAGGLAPVAALVPVASVAPGPSAAVEVGPRGYGPEHAHRHGGCCWLDREGG